MDKIGEKTYSDLVIIFKMMSPSMLQRINPKFIKTVLSKASPECKSDINPYIPLRNQKLSKQTEAFLAMMYKDYFCDEDKIVQDEKINIKAVSEQTSNNSNKLLDIRKERKISIIFNKIKNWFKKKLKV